MAMVSWWSVVLATSAGAVVTVLLHRQATAAAARDGARAERVRIARQLHDTVLQSLEAMALDPGGEPADPVA
ncbi:MAG TPA: histidine kinase, partial [Rugosimonospora sp.]|nr:histidine kinase [Rugosimonospora sp.]